MVHVSKEPYSIPVCKPTQYGRHRPGYGPCPCIDVDGRQDASCERETVKAERDLFHRLPQVSNSLKYLPVPVSLKELPEGIEDALTNPIPRRPHPTRHRAKTHAAGLSGDDSQGASWRRRGE